MLAEKISATAEIFSALAKMFSAVAEIFSPLTEKFFPPQKSSLRLQKCSPQLQKCFLQVQKSSLQPQKSFLRLQKTFLRSRRNSPKRVFRLRRDLLQFNLVTGVEYDTIIGKFNVKFYEENEMNKTIFIGLLTLMAISNAFSQELDSQQIKNPNIKYFPSKNIDKIPVPSVVFERGGLASEEERREIIKKIVYPIINTSREPVVAIVIEFLPDKKDQILVSIILREGAHIGSLIKKNENGHYDEASDMFNYDDNGCDDGEN